MVVMSDLIARLRQRRPIIVSTSSDSRYTSAMIQSALPVPSAVSLFSNCGAGDVGFAAAGFRFRVMAELEKSRLDVALCNHREAQGVQGDLRVTWRKVVDLWRRHQGSTSPDLVAACPPCQGMSTARSDRGPEDDPEAGTKDDRNLLVVPIARIVNALKPTFVVVENVTAFLRRMVKDPESGQGISAARLLVRLLEDEYEVHPFLTDLVDFGVPQTRKRAFLTFVKRGSYPADALREEGKAPYPLPTHSPDLGGEPVSLNAALKDFGLPPLDGANPALAKDSENPLHFVPVWPTSQHRMVAAIPPGSGASAWENNECNMCGPIEADAETVECPECGKVLLRPVVIEDGEPRLVHGFRRASYRRMDPKRPAATITTASGRIGGSRTIHPFENRVLSPLECALLQTIPSDFDWGDALKERKVTELRAMIGEAVPPLFTKQHGTVLAELLIGPDHFLSVIERTDRRCETARTRLWSN